MQNFAKYARYYDLLYRDKDYKAEANYVHNLIRRYSGGRKKTLLDVGCGTGGHAPWFIKNGYTVTGIDRSPEMISLAKEGLSEKGGAEFSVQDASRFALGKKFDIAVSLFHVMSYFISNELLVAGLRNIYRHLKDKGLFIFDFWYGPAVLAQRPKVKIKNLRDKGRLIKRLATPRININEDTVDIHYNLSVRNRKGALEREVSEHHNMRYFFLPELYFMLGLVGFKPVRCLKWMSFKEPVSQNSWSGLFIAKK